MCSLYLTAVFTVNICCNEKQQNAQFLTKPVSLMTDASLCEKHGFYLRQQAISCLSLTFLSSLVIKNVFKDCDLMNRNQSLEGNSHLASTPQICVITKTSAL